MGQRLHEGLLLADLGQGLLSVVHGIFGPTLGAGQGSLQRVPFAAQESVLADGRSRPAQIGLNLGVASTQKQRPGKSEVCARKEGQFRGWHLAQPPFQGQGPPGHRQRRSVRLQQACHLGVRLAGQGMRHRRFHFALLLVPTGRAPVEDGDPLRLLLV